MSKHYDEDSGTFDADAYTVAGWGAGIAWRVLGWQTEPDEDTVWSGYETRTGLVSVHMIGDDATFHVRVGDLTPINRFEYCGGCGQIGCCCDGYDREEGE